MDLLESDAFWKTIVFNPSLQPVDFGPVVPLYRCLADHPATTHPFQEELVAQTGVCTKPETKRASPFCPLPLGEQSLVQHQLQWMRFGSHCQHALAPCNWALLRLVVAVQQHGFFSTRKVSGMSQILIRLSSSNCFLEARVSRRFRPSTSHYGPSMNLGEYFLADVVQIVSHIAVIPWKKGSFGSEVGVDARLKRMTENNHRKAISSKVSI